MLKTLDLFAGAGGLSLGFAESGKYKILGAVENDPNAQKTFLKNHGDVSMMPDIAGIDFTELNTELGGIDVIIGGPPCQGFSNANRQKNNIISSNNSLVKEYFRAIKEIKPLAFVMENVSMLQSDTHRFYDTENDHIEIEKLGIELREDILYLTKKEIIEVDLLPLVKDKNKLQTVILPQKLLSLLSVLYKNRGSKIRLKKFLLNNDVEIINLIEAYVYSMPKNIYTQFTAEKLSFIQNCLACSQDVSIFIDKLAILIDYQKALQMAYEIQSNNIICSFGNKQNSLHTFAKVCSYSVIDYISAILGNEYKQKGGIVNARWYGVPQDRRRYIILGIRSDVIGDDEIHLPNQPDEIPNVTVGDAIFDLMGYQVSYDKDAPGVKMEKMSETISEYARSLRYEGLLFNHVATKTTRNALKRFQALNEGENFHKLPKELVDSYEKPERTQNTIYLRLDSSKPAGTVVNVRKSMWIHPRLDRALTIREAARLQSFPDSFVFAGTKDSQYQQVGNAVPPKMAKEIAIILAKYIEK